MFESSFCKSLLCAVHKRQILIAVLTLTGVLVFASCRPQTVVVEREVTKVVTQEKIVEQTVEVEKEITKIVKETVQIQVTATPTPIPHGGTLNMTSIGDASILNPLLADDDASDEVIDLLLAAPFETDPWTGATLPGLVEAWDVTDENKTVTYHVRQDVQWSDGQPVTARDFQFMFDALMATDDEDRPILADSPHLERVEDVQTVELIDDYTLRVTYAEGTCDNFRALDLPWLPSHVFLSDPDFEFIDLVRHSFNWEPTVASGPFLFGEWAKDDHIKLLRNPDYWKGAPYLDGIVWSVVPDATLAKEMLKSGESDMDVIDARDLSEIEQVPSLDVYRFTRTTYDFVALQIGDPDNPQARLNEDGTPNEEHGKHPILGSKQVRQALAYAIDRNEIIMKTRYGQAVPLNAHIVPLYEWAYNHELEPRDYDPEMAAQMLQDAGWVDQDKDGVRECRGCGTADEGTPMELNLKTNTGNDAREDTGILIQQQLGQVGIKVDFETMEWNAFLDTVLSQTFDMAIIGWTGVDERSSELFFASQDVPGRGFNFCSLYRPDYEQLELDARSVPGCASEDRGMIYGQIQEIMYDEQPYIWLYVTRWIIVVNKRLGNVNPAPWSTVYNIHEWYIRN